MMMTMMMMSLLLLHDKSLMMMMMMMMNAHLAFARDQESSGDELDGIAQGRVA